VRKEGKSIWSKGEIIEGREEEDHWEDQDVGGGGQ
jgi:hypothetical protein